MDKSVMIIGAGGHAKVVISTLIALGIKVNGIFDDNPDKWGRHIYNIEISGPLSKIDIHSTEPAITAIGDNKVRKDIVSRFPHLHWIAVAHPSAYVDPTVSLGKGTVVFANAVVQPDTFIGDHCIINTGATIDHDCRIGHYVHISPGVNLAGDVELEDGVFCGIDCKIINGMTIGNWVTIGAGGVVTKDLPEYSLAVGVPAKVINYVKNDK